MVGALWPFLRERGLVADSRARLQRALERPGPSTAPYRTKALNAAGNLHEDFQPAPDGFIARRANEVLGEAVTLLERIAGDSDAAGDPPLLAAIADGTFGLMKRPPGGGRGLDGVARKSDTYYNPATEQLEEK